MGTDRHPGGALLGLDPIERLSNREVQVLNLIGRGKTTREIAQDLSLSIKTVESHRQRIKKKLSLDSSPRLPLSSSLPGPTATTGAPGEPSIAACNNSAMTAQRSSPRRSTFGTRVCKLHACIAP